MPQQLFIFGAKFRFNNAGTLIITTGQDNTIRVWRPGNGEEVWSSETGSVSSAVFSAKGNEIIINNNDGSAQVVDFALAKNTIIAKGLSPSVDQTRFNRNDSLMVTSNVIDKTRIFQTDDGKQFKIVTDHQGRPCVNSAGDRFIAATSAGEVRVWDARTRRSISNLHDHAGEVQFAAFSPNGKIILIAGKDGAIRLHYTYPKDLIQPANSRLQSLEVAQKSGN